MKKTILKLIVAFFCLQLLGCDIALTQEQKIKNHVKKMMFDSDAAKFGDIKAGKEDGYFCGTVNGKNRMGAYVGYQPFIYKRVTDDYGVVTLVSEPPKNHEFKMLKGSFDFEDRYKGLYDKCQTAISYEEKCSVVDMDIPKLCKLIMQDAAPFMKELYKLN